MEAYQHQLCMRMPMSNRLLLQYICFSPNFSPPVGRWSSVRI